MLNFGIARIWVARLKHLNSFSVREDEGRFDSRFKEHFQWWLSDNELQLAGMEQNIPHRQRPAIQTARARWQCFSGEQQYGPLVLLDAKQSKERITAEFAGHLQTRSAAKV